MNRSLKVGLGMVAFCVAALPLAWFLIPEDANNGWGPFGTIMVILLFVAFPGSIMTVYGLINQATSAHRSKNP